MIRPLIFNLHENTREPQFDGCFAHRYITHDAWLSAFISQYLLLMATALDFLQVQLNSLCWRLGKELEIVTVSVTVPLSVLRLNSMYVRCFLEKASKSCL